LAKLNTWVAPPLCVGGGGVGGGVGGGGVGGGGDEVTAFFSTVMLNAGSEAEVVPELATMTMFEYVPTALACGKPWRAPEDLLKLAHVGSFLML
jgi:hypothetical protein